MGKMATKVNKMVSKVGKINRYFNNFKKCPQQKSGIVDMIMTKFALTILTIEILEF
jgi:hypothetical protein